MLEESKNVLVVLGPTASGKTALGVRLARELGGEVVSADSRQVYRELTIGSGKDLEEYVEGGGRVPYHLIDIVTLDEEFSVFDYQQRFYETVVALREREVLPVVVGGTGLYLEAALQGYRMVEAPEDPALRRELATLAEETLVARLRKLRPRMHNTTDVLNRERLVRAIEIAEYAREHAPPPAPDVRALVMGVRWSREELRRRVDRRLRERLEEGMVEEVEGLLGAGVSAERLRLLGLEYRYVTDFLEGTIKNRNDLVQKLRAAIVQFAKRQETWFRRMEKRGTEICWIEGGDVDAAVGLARQVFKR